MIGPPSFGVWFCNNKSKSTVESTFDDAKVRRIKNRKPLYRTYNRGYIGDAMPDYFSERKGTKNPAHPRMNGKYLSVKECKAL